MPAARRRAAAAAARPARPLALAALCVLVAWLALAALTPSGGITQVAAAPRPAILDAVPGPAAAAATPATGGAVKGAAMLDVDLSLLTNGKDSGSLTPMSSGDNADDSPKKNAASSSSSAAPASTPAPAKSASSSSPAAASTGKPGDAASSSAPSAATPVPTAAPTAAPQADVTLLPPSPSTTVIKVTSIKTAAGPAATAGAKNSVAGSGTNSTTSATNDLSTASTSSGGGMSSEAIIGVASLAGVAFVGMFAAVWIFRKRALKPSTQFKQKFDPNATGFRGDTRTRQADAAFARELRG